MTISLADVTLPEGEREYVTASDLEQWFSSATKVKVICLQNYPFRSSRWPHGVPCRTVLTRRHWMFIRQTFTD